MPYFLFSEKFHYSFAQLRKGCENNSTSTFGLKLKIFNREFDFG